MTESAEHKFVKRCITDTLKKFSGTKLYQYEEADRKKFDIGCALTRDWSRPVVGQVLWRNTRGIEKDLRTLLTDPNSEIKLYAISASAAHEHAVLEILADYRNSGKYPDLFKLKIIKIPPDLDLNRDLQTLSVRKIIEGQIIDDILLNVVFSNISLIDFDLLARADSGDGVYLAILHSVATGKYPSMASLSRSLSLGVNCIREFMKYLLGLGLLESISPFASTYVVSQKGRILLSILEQLNQSFELDYFSAELILILSKLGCVPQQGKSTLLVDLEIPQGYIYPLLIIGLRRCSDKWGLSFDKITFSGSLTVDLR